MKPAPTFLSLLAGVGAVALGRWLGYSWPIAVVVGIAVWLIVTGLTVRRS